MSEEEFQIHRTAFMQIIRQHPCDESRRIFADWLEENDVHLEMVPLLRGESEKWIREFADYFDLSYEEFMKVAAAHVANMLSGGFWDGIVEYDSESWRSHFYANDTEFWKHYEIMTGVDGKDAGSFFSCSC